MSAASQTNHPEKLLTAAEAAEILRVKPDFVRSLVRRGVLRGYHIGGPIKPRTMVPEAAIQQYLDSCEVKTEPTLPPKRNASIRANNASMPMHEKYGPKT